MKRLLSVIFLSVILTGLVWASGQIDIAYSPYTINQPGSYIVVKDLTTAQNLNCITVSTSDVTIDLNGHTLYGAGTTAGSTGNGIFDSTSGGVNNITVFNGTIRNFRETGINLKGINEQVRQVKAFANKIYGINVGTVLYSGGGLVSDCNAAYNGNVGIYCTGGVVRDSLATNNSLYGIYGIEGCVITGNEVISNGGDGINAVIATISHNNVLFNLGDGISAQGSLIEDNNVLYNNFNGIKCLSSRVVNNSIQLNGSIGSILSIGKGAGINATHDNTIENNSIFSNDTGILTTSTANFIAGNRIHLNTVSISTSSGNFLGDGTTSFFNKIYYSQPNLLIQQYAGFDIPSLHESPQAVLRTLRW